MCYSKQRVKDKTRHQDSAVNEDYQNASNTLHPTEDTKQRHKGSPNNENTMHQTQNQNNVKEGVRDVKINDHENSVNSVSIKGKSSSSHEPTDGLGKIKQVCLHKHDSDELGMAILGGVEHGLPIMISEVFPGSSVGRSQKVR